MPLFIKGSVRIKVSHVKLNSKQTSVRNKIQDKIDNGIYKLEETPCLCGEQDDSIISETDRYGLSLNTVICKRCGLLRTNPRLDSKSLEEFYKKEYRDLYMGPEYGNMNTYLTNMIERGREIIDLIKKQLQLELRGLEVLEIGCSVGGILVPFLEASVSVKGFDYDRRYLDYGNKHNSLLNLQLGGIENLKDEVKKYDLILINHVLEHLLDPIYAIQLIKKSLKTNGTLYVSVPGFKNPKYYFSPTKSFLGSLHIAHLYHFTKISLIRLLNEFEVIYIDNEIRSIFCVNSKGKTHLKENMVSEYNDNVAFLKSYEKSFGRKIWRLKTFLKNLPQRPSLPC